MSMTASLSRHLSNRLRQWQHMITRPTTLWTTNKRRTYVHRMARTYAQRMRSKTGGLRLGQQETLAKRAAVQRMSSAPSYRREWHGRQQAARAAFQRMSSAPSCCRGPQAAVQRMNCKTGRVGENGHRETERMVSARENHFQS